MTVRPIRRYEDIKIMSQSLKVCFVDDQSSDLSDVADGKQCCKGNRSIGDEDDDDGTEDYSKLNCNARLIELNYERWHF